MTQDTRLSYSSATMLQTCSQKYFYYKVAGLAFDEDFEQDSKAFDVGKAFHQILENTMHTRSESLSSELDKSCKDFNVENEKAMIYAMVLKYLDLHERSGLECKATEFQLSTEDYIGFVDVILTGKDGWWIADLKTASMFSELTAAKLRNDFQLNLYSFFAPDIAAQFDLDPDQFRGCRYRVTTKSRGKYAEYQDFTKAVKSFYKGVHSFDVVVPKEIMSPEVAMARHKELHDFSMSLRTGESKPQKNFKACDEYFRACQYWSQCHGETFSDCKSLIQVESTK